jgi:hypothetical protein
MRQTPMPPATSMTPPVIAVMYGMAVQAKAGFGRTMLEAVVAQA